MSDQPLPHQPFSARPGQLPVQGAYAVLDDLLSLRFSARELRLTPRRQSQSLQSGGLRTRFRGRGMEFEEVRLYQPGDDIRNIDWRVTARTQVPHTKLFREERERPVMIMLDQRATLFFGSRHGFKSVLATHAAALLGWAALHNNDRIGGLIFSDTDECDIRPRRSRHTLLSLLQAAQRFNHQLTSPLAPAGATPLAQRLQDMRRIARPGSAIMIISDFHDLDSHCEEQLYQLSRHNDLSLLCVTDPLEQQLPGGRQLTVTDGRQRRLLDTREPGVRQTYADNYQQHWQRLQQLAAQRGMALVELNTGQPPLLQLQRCFGRRR